GNGVRESRSWFAGGGRSGAPAGGCVPASVFYRRGLRAVCGVVSAAWRVVAVSWWGAEVVAAVDGCGGGRERGQDRACGDRASGCGLFRPGLPRAVAAGALDDGEGVVQERVRAVSGGGLSRAGAVSVPWCELG